MLGSYKEVFYYFLFVRLVSEVLSIAEI